MIGEDWRDAGVKDPSDYSAIFKRKLDATNKWRWEIHRVGRSSPIKSSGYVFDSMSVAKRAANEALRDYIEKLQKRRPTGRLIFSNRPAVADHIRDFPKTV